MKTNNNTDLQVNSDLLDTTNHTNHTNTSGVPSKVGVHWIPAHIEEVVKNWKQVMKVRVPGWAQRLEVVVKYWKQVMSPSARLDTIHRSTHTPILFGRNLSTRLSLCAVTTDMRHRHSCPLPSLSPSCIHHSSAVSSSEPSIHTYRSMSL